MGVPLPAIQQHNFNRLTGAIGLPLTPEQERTILWLAGWERESCERIAHLFERVRAVEKCAQEEASEELLASLKNLLAEADDDGITRAGVDRAFAAIAKAEGERHAPAK